ncbi:MAG: four helix bundle protein [Deferribacteres bacterium]|nr:four helix bundle protein [Deferribacteres bacterium]
MNVEDLDVFKLSHELAIRIYKTTGRFPDAEKFGLTSQMRRASASIPANLAEGGHRFSKNEYKHFISIARGSVGEIKYQLLLSRDLGYIKKSSYSELRESYDRVSMMLTKLHSSLKRTDTGNGHAERSFPRPHE